MEDFSHNMDNYQGETFLNRLYKDLHLSDEVMHTATKSDNKNEKVSKYLNRLEKVETLAKSSNYNGLFLLKNMYYQKYIIKKENIPEQYFEKQKNIAFERGFGHVEFSQTEKDQMIEILIEDQKKSLDIWLDYFLSDDCIYPEWFKYYAFQGMIKLGSFDKQNGSFNRRTAKTTTIFIDLNREALALIYDNLVNVLDGKTVDDSLLQKLLEDGSFSRLYAYMLAKLDQEKKFVPDNKEGIWINYNRSSDPELLVNTLIGKGTGWCIAGKETAASYLEQGDFYIYYTKDSNDEYKQPRIAIRMKGDSIEEIRGIAEKQNLESEMEEVLNQKLKEFPDCEKYYQKVNDMEQLTKIYKEYQNRELTTEELRFLYQVDRMIEGFGYGKDPRIEEILEQRDFKKDLSQVFDCSLDEISNDRREVLNGKKITYFYGDLDLNFLYPDLDSFKITLPSYVIGDLWLGSLVNVKNIIFPKYVRDNLDLSAVDTVEDCVFPDYIGGDLLLNTTDTIENTVLPKQVLGYVYIPWLTDLRNITFPEMVGGSLYLINLTNTENVVLPKCVKGTLNLGSKKNVEGLVVPPNFQYHALVSDFISMQDLIDKSLEESAIHSIQSIQSIHFSYSPKQHGFSKMWLLVFLNFFLSIGMLVLGIFWTR